MKTILSTLCLIFTLACACNLAHANNGTGSADFCERHCGTVPTECPACPDVVCPDVTCPTDGDTHTTIVVGRVSCPAYELQPCTRYTNKKTGKVKDVCPRKMTPRRVLKPLRETTPMLP